MPRKTAAPALCALLALLIASPAFAAHHRHHHKKKKTKAEPAAQVTAPAAPPASAELPVAPLAPPPEVPAEAAPVRLHTIEARPDTPVRAEPEAQAIAAPAAPAASADAAFSLGVRAGPLVPLYFLKPGYLAGAELQAGLPVLDGRLRAALFAGYGQAAGIGERIVQGRGIDPAFIENLSFVPVELTLNADLWRDDQRALVLGAGYAAWFGSATFLALGQTETHRGIGHVATGALAFRQRMGPGDAGIGVRMNVGRLPLGALGQAGTESLTSFAVDVSYAYGLLPGDHK